MSPLLHENSKKVIAKVKLILDGKPYTNIMLRFAYILQNGNYKCGDKLHRLTKLSHIRKNITIN